MKNLFTLLLIVVNVQLFAINQESVFKIKPVDQEALYFTPENFSFRNDGKTDVSDALQNAINQLKKQKNFGILFIPEGRYIISKTIYIPNAIRLIGFGENRPEFILKENSPGFQEEPSRDKGKAKYMFWFTGAIVEGEQPPRDAGAGTFYSAMSNINLIIEDENPYAIALRTHYAQHSFISHVNIYIGNGKAGIFDIGNEMENVAFYGGNYGIYTTKASPGWPVMLVDSYFEGQRIAALHCQESGLAIVNLQAKNVPTVIEIEADYSDRIILENCRFEDVTGPALIISNENNSNNQITIRNNDCKNVPVFVRYRKSKTETTVNYNTYKVREFDYGLQMDDMLSEPGYRTVSHIIPVNSLPAPLMCDIPALPDMRSWVNIKDLGAIGDGITDNTKIFQEAIANHKNIYVPQGWYRITETLKLAKGTKLIGLHPYGTQILINESEPAFSGFGAPKPLIESSEGGDDILNGIGINSGAYNFRAVGCKWMAGESSLMNDVKFVGGHGTMRKPVTTSENQNLTRGGRGPREISTPENPVHARGMDLAWDNQYWSLWVTNNGGGTFKDIWTASTYAASGLYVNNTSTPARIYAMSLEHHVRNEATFKNVSNWKMYCFQLEEESLEGADCQPVELINCHDLVFANLYMFRVIRFNKPYHNSIRVWNCRNIEFLNLHNFSQIKYTTDIPIYDINKNIEVRPWELQKIIINGEEPSQRQNNEEPYKANILASGFEFTEGITRDSKGNIYFCEHRMRRIYKWCSESNTVSFITDFPWKPINLACDSEDNLLVTFRYDPQPGIPEEQQISAGTLPDAGGTSFSGWGNSGFAIAVYSIKPENPEETISLMPMFPMKDIKHVHKALYPANRWRDFHDFNTVSLRVPENCFIAPDGKTIIPQCYDLARSSALLEAYPGIPFYASDEYDKRIVKMEVQPNGTLKNLQYFAEWGEFGLAVDSEGKVYVADGNIYVFDKSGNKLNMITVPERPSSIQFGGRNNDRLFITGRSKFYSIKL